MRNTTHHWMIAVLVLAGVGALGLIYTSPEGSVGLDPSSTTASAPVNSSAAATSTPRREAKTLVGLRGAAPESTGDALAAADGKRRLLEEQRAADIEEPRDLGLEGPRPEPTIDLQEIQSNAELELEPGVKAKQARRLSDALSSRAADVRERVELAREQGDEAEAIRQERILARLEARTNTLVRSSATFAEEARVEGEGEGVDDSHEHEHG